MKALFAYLKQTLSRVYRVSFIDNETLSQRRQYLIKPISVVLVALVLLVGIIGGTASLIVFTPSIREQIPGYLNPQYEVQVREMQQQLEMMTTQVEQRDSLVLSFLRMGGRLDDSMLARLRIITNDSLIQAQNAPVVSNTNVEIEDEASNDPPAQPPAAEVQEAPAPVKIVYVNNPVGVSPSSPAQALLNLYPPISGEIRAPFNMEKGHYGVDIVADEGAMVMAATDGRVIYAEYSEKDGHVIGLANQQGILTFYKHNSRLLARVGDIVLAGEGVAVIGNTGENSSGPHLHFELWYQGRPVDPMTYYKGL
ncbi:MAG: M23 family metallopeptidase [Bacteroidota bacterium]